MFRYFSCHQYAIWVHPFFNCLLFEIFSSICRVLKNPQDRIWNCFQNCHPDLESVGIKFIELVEIRKNELILRQPIICTSRPLLTEYVAWGLPVVIEKIRIWHIDRFFGVIVVHNVWRWSYLIRNQIVYVIRASSSAKTHKWDLYRSRPKWKRVLSATRRPTIQIEQNLYVFGVDEWGQVKGRDALFHLVKLVTCICNIISPFAVVVLPQRKGDDLKDWSIVKGEQAIE